MHYRKAAGLSLIEVMIALLIGSLLILGLVQVFSASRAAYQLSEGLARTQENARFAIDFLQRDIRMAGHFGCVNDQAHFVKNEGDPTVRFSPSIPSGSGHALDFSVTIQGYEAQDTAPGQDLTLGAVWPAAPGLPAHIQALNPLPGSDILVLRYLHGEGAPVTAIAPGGSGEALTVDTNRWSALTSGGVAAPVLYGISDCNHADVFQGVAAPTTTVTTAANYNFGDRYTPFPNGLTTLYRAESLAYYIAAGATGEPALWRARADATGAYPVADREELVEGIENLQILYGQDDVDVISSTTPPVGNINEQHTAAGVVAGAGTAAARAAEWRRVGLVQVGLLVRSPNPAAAGQADAAAQRQRVLGVEFVPGATNDTRFRSSYEATIALRNRLFGN